MNKEQILYLLNTEVLPTFGCTEPGAVALAAAYAAKELGNLKINKIKVTVNPNVYKNGVAVGIPGTGETGMPIAAAIGALKKNPEKQLSVLSNITKEELEKAKLIVPLVTVEVDKTKDSLWVCVHIEAGDNWAEALLKDKHTNLVRLIKNKQVLLDKESALTKNIQEEMMSEIERAMHLAMQSVNGTEKEQISFKAENAKNEQKTVDNHEEKMVDWNKVTVSEVINTLQSMSEAELAFMNDGVKMNYRAAEIGMQKEVGMKIGAIYADLIQKKTISDDFVTRAKMYTAAATDARMSGENVEIMSSAGSGNHGITATMPVLAVAEKIGIKGEKFNRAIALSHVINVYVKNYTGKLSAICGCAVAAATGATAAIAWLLGGNAEVISGAMKNVVANLTGMICDGGKIGCSLKLTAAADAAVTSAVLAKRGIVVPDTNGIIAKTAEETVRNLGKIANPGMMFTDQVIMDVMIQKSENEDSCQVKSEL